MRLVYFLEHFVLWQSLYVVNNWLQLGTIISNEEQLSVDNIYHHVYLCSMQELNPRQVVLQLIVPLHESCRQIAFLS